MRFWKRAGFKTRFAWRPHFLEDTREWIWMETVYLVIWGDSPFGFRTYFSSQTEADAWATRFRNV